MYHQKIKDHKSESRLFTFRAIAALILVLLLIGAVVGRLAYLQIFKYNLYSTLSKQNVLNVMPIEPNRGLIFDRNGVLLAQNLPTFSLKIIPVRSKNINQTIKELKKIIDITPSDIEEFYRSRTSYRPYQPIPLKMKLDEAEVARFYLDQFRFPGVTIEPQMMRYYPLGETVSNIIGYVGRINQQEYNKVDHAQYLPSDYIGKAGIERYYEDNLHGLVGAAEAEIDAGSKIVRMINRIAPNPGSNIYLTIDSQVQAYAKKLMGDEAGAIVAIIPNTGEIIALVTNPGYDDNQFVNGISRATYASLFNTPLHPLYNRAVRGLYSPGSTIKPFFAIAGLNDGVVDTRYKIFDPGWFQLPNSSHIYHDWVKRGHGVVNIVKAIIVSCDVFFYNLSMRLGINRMSNMLDHFGFGKLTGIDLFEEHAGVVPTPEWKLGAQGQHWYPGDTVNTGIGQGALVVTPLQLAVAVSTIAERGIRHQPHLLLKTVDANGKETRPSIPPVKAVVLRDPKIWDTIIGAMEGVVMNPSGTAGGQFGRNAPYTVAAKTGTAQVYGKQRNEEEVEHFDESKIAKELRNNHLFICFAPVEEPKIALGIVIEHTSLAVKIGRQLIDFYFLSEQQRAANPLGISTGYSTNNMKTPPLPVKIPLRRPTTSTNSSSSSPPSPIIIPMRRQN